jgi:hypothetical protein
VDWSVVFIVVVIWVKQFTKLDIIFKEWGVSNYASCYHKKFLPVSYTYLVQCLSLIQTINICIIQGKLAKETSEMEELKKTLDE